MTVRPFVVLLVALVWSSITVAQTALFSGASPTQQYNTQVFNCSSFATSGTCGVKFPQTGTNENFSVYGSQNGTTPTISGSSVLLIDNTNGHVALNLNYYVGAVNVQKFQTTFSFVPNGWNVSFVLNNSNNNSGANGVAFAAGAGCEGSIFQGFSQPAPPNNTFAIMFDQWSSLTGGASWNNSVDTSSVQYYTPGVFASNAPSPPGQSPCNPNLGGTDFTYAGVNKISTSPVSLNNGLHTQNVSTGDTYIAQVTYDGSNLTVTLYDQTLGGTCTPVTSGTCFTTSWSSVNIPSIVGSSNTAWVGLASASNGVASGPNQTFIKSWSYFTP